MLLKQLTLIGAPQMLSALIPWAKVQTAGEGKGEEKRGELDLEQWYDTLIVFQDTQPSIHLNSLLYLGPNYPFLPFTPVASKQSPPSTAPSGPPYSAPSARTGQKWGSTNSPWSTVYIYPISAF